MGNFSKPTQTKYNILKPRNPNFLKLSFTMSVHRDLSFEQGWPVLQEAINKLIDPSSGQVHTPHFTTDEYMNIYKATYDICTRNPSGPESRKMFERFNITIEDHIKSKILPSLRDMKDDVPLVQEVVKRWDDNKIIAKWLPRFFHYLDRFYVPRNKFPTLTRICHLSFYKLVYGEMKDQVRDALISLVNREREGEDIDQALVKNVLAIYVDMGEDSIRQYEEFEEALVKNTAAFYSAKASNWIANDSYSDYMLKVDECLKQEIDRCSIYLQDRIQYKLLEVVQHELVTVHATKLEEKRLVDTNDA